MVKLGDFFDEYSLRARLRPALLTLFPALVTIASLFPTTYKTMGTALGSLAITCGVLGLFAQAARYLGRRKELILYERWGGMPTTVWLRHRDINLDPMTKKRYHNFLLKHVPKLKLPTVEKEQENPKVADDCYRSATKWLLEYTRNKKTFPLVFEENINYGFQRNTLALKPTALVIIALCICGTVLDAKLESVFDLSSFEQGSFISLGVSFVALIVWLTVVSSDWVKDAANAYTRALLVVLCY